MPERSDMLRHTNSRVSGECAQRKRHASAHRRNASRARARGSKRTLYSGWWNYQNDLQRFDAIESEPDRITHSRFLLYCAHGMMLFGNRVQSLQYAMRRIGYEPAKPPTMNPQMWLDLEAALARTRRTVPS
jgi:hypothetical protein